MKVLLVSMPFGGLRPAIGISLLAVRLREIGVEASCLYLNVRFAGRVGVDTYELIAETTSSSTLAGDWVFAEAGFGHRPQADEAYLAALAGRLGRSSEEIEALVRARAAAADFVDEVEREVDWGAWDIVGFTSTFSQNAASLALARRIRERGPAPLIAFGGANCEGEMGLALHRAFGFIDFVCSGEADRSFPELVSRLASGADDLDIPGVISRRGDTSHHVRLTPEPVRDLDEVPVPEYDDYVAQTRRWLPAQERGPVVLLEASRGCWWGEKSHCTFCGLNGQSMKFRSKSADRVLREITTMVDRYRPRYIQMVDNILDMGYFSDLIPKLRDSGLEVGMFFEVKSNLSKDRVRALHAAGIRTLQPGIESLSDPILRSMRKGTTALQNVQLLKWCREVGIDVQWNLLYGFPGEDPAEYDKMCGVIDVIGHLQPPVVVSAVRLDRFSPYFVEADSLGVRNIRPIRAYEHVYDLPADLLAGLAYYFEFDYADGRDPEDYAGGIRAAVGRWRDNLGGGDLLYADHGDKLVIWDLRAGARREITVLTGPKREAFLFCDRHRARREVERLLCERGLAEDAAGAFLTGLVDDRLMLEIDGRLLSLAVMVVPADRDSVARGSIPQMRQPEPGLACAREPSPDVPMADGRRTLPVTLA